MQRAVTGPLGQQQESVLVLAVAQALHKPFVNGLVRVLFRQKGLKYPALPGKSFVSGPVQQNAHFDCASRPGVTLTGQNLPQWTALVSSLRVFVFHQRGQGNNRRALSALQPGGG